jgi:hypothetical protein
MAHDPVADDADAAVLDGETGFRSDKARAAQMMGEPKAEARRIHGHHGVGLQLHGRLGGLTEAPERAGQMPQDLGKAHHRELAHRKQAIQPLAFALRTAAPAKRTLPPVSRLSAAIKPPARLYPEASPETMKISGSRQPIAFANPDIVVSEVVCRFQRFRQDMNVAAWPCRMPASSRSSQTIPSSMEKCRPDLATRTPR